MIVAVAPGVALMVSKDLLEAQIFSNAVVVGIDTSTTIVFVLSIPELNGKVVTAVVDP